MPRPAFTLRQLEYFEQVAAAGSLTAAAVRCQVTPSALTLSIDDLERRLQVKLLVRAKGRGVTLTPAGRRLLTHTRDVLAKVEDLVDEASDEVTALSGRFTVGCFTTLSPFFGPLIIEKFARDYPNIDIRVSACSVEELLDGLSQGRLDVALLYNFDVPSSVEFDPVCRYAPHILLAADHPLASRDSISLFELADEPLILLDLKPAESNTMRTIRDVGFTPEVRFRSSNHEEVRCLVGAGLGYSILLQRPLSNITYTGHKVAMVDIVESLPIGIVGIASLKGTHQTARHQALHAFLAETMQRQHDM